MVDIRFRYKIALSCIVVMMVFVTLSGFSYAYFTVSVKGTGNPVNLTTGEVTMNFTSGTENIALTNEYPKSDTEGLNGTAYTFNLQNNNGYKVTALIYLSVLNGSSAELNKYIKVAYKSNGTGDYVSKLLDFDNTKAETLWPKTDEEIEPGATSFLLDTVTLDNGVNRNDNSLKLWIDSSAGTIQGCTIGDDQENCETTADITMGKTFKARIIVKTIADNVAQDKTPAAVSPAINTEGVAEPSIG